MSKLVDAVDSGMHPSNTDAQNQTALQAAITTAAASGGGTIVIPCFDPAIGSDNGAYPLAGPVAIGNGSSSVEVIVAGSTGNVKLKHTGLNDVFQVNNVWS